MHRLSRARVLSVIAITGVMLMGAKALADESATHSRNSRRQIADCIIKKMSANRAVSFNDATRACKDQAKAQDGSLVANTPAKTLSSR
jgi:hypothetical protein